MQRASPSSLSAILIVESWARCHSAPAECSFSASLPSFRTPTRRGKAPHSDENQLLIKIRVAARLRGMGRVEMLVIQTGFAPLIADLLGARTAALRNARQARWRWADLLLRD